MSIYLLFALKEQEKTKDVNCNYIYPGDCGSLGRGSRLAERTSAVSFGRGGNGRKRIKGNSSLHVCCGLWQSWLEEEVGHR